MNRHGKGTAVMAGMLVLITLTGCKSSDDKGDVVYMLPETKAMSLTTEQQSMVNDNNSFALSLFQKTIETQEEKDKSVFMSPIGVSFMLGMIQSGASTETQRQTAKAMGFDGKDSQTVNSWCRSILTQAPQLDPQVTFLDANAIYVNKGFGLQDAYKEAMRDYYEAGIGSLDFASPKAVKTINKWCSDNTKGMIPAVLDKTKEDAVCYLLNAVYFEAKWTHQFDKADTRDETFTTESGETLTVPMMHNKARVRAYQDDDLTLVCLPYGSGSPWNMLVILPAEGKTVADIAAMPAARIAEAWRQARVYDLDIKIPKFSLQTSYDLTETLPKLGITNIFDSQNSGLDGICKTKDGDLGVYVSNMFQKAAIDVTEEGSKATAVTVAEMALTSPGPQLYDNGEFHADRPFVYLITENVSDAIFFVGTYTGK